jgi:CBS domain-containing protein
MRVNEVMNSDVRLARPEQSIQEAARIMVEIDAGVLPVANDDRLVGMITDRDIAARAVAVGKGPQTRVEEVMTADTKYCYDDQDTSEVAQNMAELQVRRLPVMNRNKRLVGIVSLGDLATLDGEAVAARAIRGISTPGGRSSQTTQAPKL